MRSGVYISIVTGDLWLLTNEENTFEFEFQEHLLTVFLQLTNEELMESSAYLGDL